MSTPGAVEEVQESSKVATTQEPYFTAWRVTSHLTAFSPSRPFDLCNCMKCRRTVTTRIAGPIAGVTSVSEDSGGEQRPTSEKLCIEMQSHLSITLLIVITIPEPFLRAPGTKVLRSRCCIRRPQTASLGNNSPGEFSVRPLGRLRWVNFGHLSALAPVDLSIVPEVKCRN